MAEEGGIRQVKFNAQTMIEILSNFNIKVTPQDLKGQNLDKLIEIYKTFLKTCLNVDEPGLDNFTYEITSNFTEEVLSYQKNAFKRIQLYSLIYALYEMCGLKGHCSEVFFPYVHAKNMFNKQLSTLVNFARFEYIQLEDFSSIQEEYKIKSKEVAEIQTKNAWYKSQISTLKQDKAERRIPIENAKKRISMLTERLGQIRAHNKRVDEEIAKFEKEIANLQAEKEEVTNRINTNQKRSQFLDKLLIKSPEKLKKDIEKNKIKIADTEKLIQSKKVENERLANAYAEREKFVDGFKFFMESLDNFYLNDVQSANKMMKEIEEDKEEKINLEFQVEQFESKIKIQMKDKEKKEKEYEQYCEDVEKEMIALSTKDQFYEAQANKILSRTKNLEKAITEVKTEQKASIEQFQSYMNKEMKAVEYIQRQREGLESKRRIFEEVHNHIRSNFAKRAEKDLATFVAEEEALIDIKKHMKI